MSATVFGAGLSSAETLGHSSERRWECREGAGRRCHKCYAPDIVAVCASCGAYLCAGCRREIQPWYERRHTGWLPGAVHAREESVYCDAHRPQRISRTFLLFSALLLLSIVVTLVGAPAWVWLLVIGTAAVLVSIRHRIDHFILQRTEGLPDDVMILPHYTVDLQESLALDFRLGMPRQSYLDAGRGTLRLTTTLNPKTTEAPLRGSAAKQRGSRAVRAGFFRLGLPVEGRFEMPPGWVSRDERALPLAAKVRAPADMDDILRAGLKSDLQFDWVPEAPPDADRGWQPPFIVRPYAAASRHNSRCWGLEFVLCRDAISSLILRSLIVEVPPGLGSVERSEGGAPFGPTRVRWTNLVVTSARPARIALEFAQPVYKCEAITCTYEMEIPDASLAGLSLDHRDFWFATGRALEASHISVKRQARIDGRITVASRLQPTREEVTARKDATLLGVRLSDAEAHQVIAALAEHGVEAKDVVESRIDAGASTRSQAPSRHWEILGRHYVEDQPYDVHIMLTADVIRDRDATGETSTPVVTAWIVVRTLAEWSFLQRQRQDVDAVCAALLMAITSALEAPAS